VPRLPAVALALLLGCQTPVEPAAPPRATSDSPRTAPPPPAPPPAASPPAAAESKAQPESEPEPLSREARTRSGGSTRGVIQCGDASCEGGKQVCAGTSEWQCVAADMLPSAAEVYYACDDGTDCPNGETCCLGFESALEGYVCSKRNGPETNCRLEICAGGGAPCPKGQVCSDGTCRAPDPVATCEGRRCPSERPLCLYSERGAVCSTWQELQALESEVQTAALRCTRRSDCGPEARCCTNALWNATQCLTHCDAANEGEVCTRDADCTGVAGHSGRGKCRSARGGDVASLPAWLKVCEFDSP
jgi:hypothetical protein